MIKKACLKELSGKAVSIILKPPHVCVPPNPQCICRHGKWKKNNNKKSENVSFEGNWVLNEVKQTQRANRSCLTPRVYSEKNVIAEVLLCGRAVGTDSDGDD